MEQYRMQRSELLEINRDVAALTSEAGTVAGLSNGILQEWENACHEIQRQLSDDIVRVAVVGAIKSGKSTFVNSLFMGDYVMRGAGVITSIVTRVRKGNDLNATLYFKSWDEINSEIAAATILLPSADRRLTDDGFDIRREQSRELLQKALDDLDSDQWIIDDTRNMNSMLLLSYLRGYGEVKEIIHPDTETRQHFKKNFGEHRSFVANDALAVYLRDIGLEINSGDLDPRIEIADCQGSDSPNPLHLTAIQDYLVRTHLIVYVISSRTGLRQADIKFLSMIKKMGIMDNMLFVLNCDFSEHDSIDDLNRLVARAEEELALIKPDPVLFPISALYNLFKSRKEALPQRDRQRLSQWKKEKALTGFSDLNADQFMSAFYDKVTSGRSSLLLKNNVERLNVIVSGVKDWVKINHEIFSRDAESAGKIIDKITQHQLQINSIKSMINSTLDGAVQKVKQELKADVDGFFDVRYGDVTADVVALIRGFTISFSDYRETLDTAGFSNTLYQVFQEFKQTLDTFMAETINPEVIRFVRSKEEWIRQYLESIATPYKSIAREALNEYADSMGELGILLNPNSLHGLDLPDTETIKTVAGLTLPTAAAVMHYSTKIRTEAVIRLGFYSLAKVFKRMLRKKVQTGKEEGLLALKDGVSRMKKDTERSVIAHFKDYKENIKFQYLFKIVDAIAASFSKILGDRFRACDTDLTQLSDQIDKRQDDRQIISETLHGMANATDAIELRIQLLRKNINS
jgi:dynamin family protein